MNQVKTIQLDQTPDIKEIEGRSLVPINPIITQIDMLEAYEKDYNHYENMEAKIAVEK